MIQKNYEIVYITQYFLAKEMPEPFVIRSENKVCFDIGEMSNEARETLGENAINELKGRNDDQIEWVDVTYSEADWYGTNGTNGKSWVELLKEAQGKGGN